MNCRIGDIAVLIAVDNPALAENIGAFVEVIGPGVWGEWNVRVCGTPLIGHLGNLVTRGDVYDRNLRPIRGEPERESITHHQPTTADA